MKVFTASLESVSVYCQSKHHETPKLQDGKERPDDYENRTWRERMHVDKTGHVFIPAMCFKNSIAEAAKFISMPISGKRNATYTKHFEAGILVTEGLTLDVKKDEVEPLRLFVPSDGVPGSGKRVWKNFPQIQEWSGEVVYYVLDEIISKEVFEKHLVASGQFIGVGAFRPRNRGVCGRFKVVSVKETEAKL